MKTHRSVPNITRFTYKRAAFQGWRVCKSVKGVTFTKYFPDKDHARKKDPGAGSFAAAKTALKELVSRSQKHTSKQVQKWAAKEGFTVKAPVLV